VAISDRELRKFFGTETVPKFGERSRANQQYLRAGNTQADVVRHLRETMPSLGNVDISVFLGKDKLPKWKRKRKK
jgi:hypothetical protein